MSQLASTVSLIAFAIASMLYLASFRGRLVKKNLANLAVAAFGTATVGILLVLSGRPDGIDPFRDSGLLLAGILGCLTLVGHLRFSMKTVGAFIAPLITLILVIQFYVSPLAIPMDVTGYPKKFLAAHVTLAILGEAFAICACGVAGVYLRQQRALKLKILDQGTDDVPALDRLEWVLKMALWTGFILITCSLLSGALYSQYWGNGSGHWIKLGWSITVWLWYLIMLICRLVFGLPMKMIARLSFGGFLLLATTFFGIQDFTPPPGGP